MEELIHKENVIYKDLLTIPTHYTHCSYIHICQHLNMYIQYTCIYSYVYRYIKGGINSAFNEVGQPSVQCYAQ